jgi:hypothetical protein
MGTSNRFTRLAPQEYISQYIPTNFDDIFKAGAYKEKAYDEGEEQAAKLSGLAASLNPAPGHEGLASRVAGGYNESLSNLVDQYKDYGDPEFKRQLRRQVYKFAADPEVKKVINSREYYEKNIAPNLPELQAKGAYFTSPYMEKGTKAQFKPNELLYSGFDYAIGDPKAEIDKDLNEVATQVKADPTSFGAFIYKDSKNPSNPLNGKVVTREGDRVREWRDEDTFNATKNAILGDWIEHQDITPGRKRFWAEFENPRQLSDFIEQQMPKYFVNKQTNKANYSIPSLDYGSGEQNPQAQGDAMYYGNHSRDVYNPMIEEVEQTKQLGRWGGLAQIKNYSAQQKLETLSPKTKRTMELIMEEIPGDTETKFAEAAKVLEENKYYQVAPSYRPYDQSKETDVKKKDQLWVNSNSFLVLSNDGVKSLNEFLADNNIKDKNKFDVLGEQTMYNTNRQRAINMGIPEEEANLFTQSQLIRVNGKLYPVGMNQSEAEQPEIIKDEDGTSLAAFSRADYGRIISDIASAKITGLPVPLDENEFGSGAAVKYNKKTGEFGIRYFGENGQDVVKITDTDPKKVFNNYIKSLKIREQQ